MKKVKKAKKPLQVVQGSSDDLIASLVAKAQTAAPAPALTIKVEGLDESPMDVASPVAPAPVAAPPAVPELSDAEKAAKEEKKRLANEKRKATLAAKKAKKAEEDALAAQMSSMTIQTELTPEKVETPSAPKPVESPKAPTPKAESPKKSGGATQITLEGTTYYNQEGWLYDMQSKECVGFWNGEEIEPVEEESDEEE